MDSKKMVTETIPFSRAWNLMNRLGTQCFLGVDPNEGIRASRYEPIMVEEDWERINFEKMEIPAVLALYHLGPNFVIVETSDPVDPQHLRNFFFDKDGNKTLTDEMVGKWFREDITRWFFGAYKTPEHYYYYVYDGNNVEQWDKLTYKDEEYPIDRIVCGRRSIVALSSQRLFLTYSRAYTDLTWEWDHMMETPVNCYTVIEYGDIYVGTEKGVWFYNRHSDWKVLTGTEDFNVTSFSWMHSSRGMPMYALTTTDGIYASIDGRRWNKISSPDPTYNTYNILGYSVKNNKLLVANHDNPVENFAATNRWLENMLR